MEVSKTLRCFVIQRFDNGPFDKGYRDVIVPAVKRAGLQPYRVDEDPRATVPIEEIEQGIRNSSSIVSHGCPATGPRRENNPLATALPPIPTTKF